MGASLLLHNAIEPVSVALILHLGVLTGKSANKAGSLEGGIDDQN